MMYTIELSEFPSPCGDKLQLISGALVMIAFLFPSPCGDELQSKVLYFETISKRFPSPCGDKLQFSTSGQWQRSISFRPLAGMNCNLCFVA